MEFNCDKGINQILASSLMHFLWNSILNKGLITYLPYHTCIFLWNSIVTRNVLNSCLTPDTLCVEINCDKGINQILAPPLMPFLLSSIVTKGSTKYSPHQWYTCCRTQLWQRDYSNACLTFNAVFVELNCDKGINQILSLLLMLFLWNSVVTKRSVKYLPKY